MKKNLKFNFNKVIAVIAIVGTLITLFIVYSKIDNTFALYFVIGYVIYLMVFLIYSILFIFLNARKLKWTDIRKRLLMFIIVFVTLRISNYLISFIINPSSVSFLKGIDSSLGLAMGVSFFDLLFIKKNK